MTFLLRSKFLQLGICCATKVKTFNAVVRHVNIPQISVVSQYLPSRQLSLSTPSLQEAEAQDDAEGDDDDNEIENPKLVKIHDVETSMRYLKSNAYKLTYAGAKVWEPYRRNHKGRRPKKLTRRTCIRAGMLATGNPCPICRDEYLVIHHKNVELLKQFILPTTGQLVPTETTGVCQKQQKKLQVALFKAWDQGYIKMPIPVRLYDYKEYFPQIREQQEQQQKQQKKKQAEK